MKQTLLDMDIATYKLISSYQNIIRKVDAFKFSLVYFLKDFAQRSSMCVLFCFWLHREACGILVPQPGN